MKLKYIYITIALFVVSFGMYGQISITSLPATYSNNFDSYNPSVVGNVPSTINSTGTGSGLSSATTGWTAASSGTQTYIGRTTSGNSGGYIAYGSSSAYSLGALRSGTPGNITYTLSFTNNSGSTITSLTLAWNYKQWTYVNTSGWNITGTGALSSNTTLNASDFAGSATGTNGTPTTTAVSSFTLSGLSIANGASFGFTWVTTDVSGSDSGVAIDDFSLAASAAVTPTSTITAGAGAEPSTISSLINTSVASVLNFDFTVTDDGATAATDALTTNISQIVIDQGTGNDITTWTQVIAGAELTDGTNTLVGTVNAANITFASILNTINTLGYIADNAAKTYTLRVWLNSALGGSLPTTIDGLNLVFRVQNSGFTFNGGSTLSTGQDQNSGSANNAVAVVATKLVFVQQPSNTNVNVAMTPSPTVRAYDANNNTDLEYATAVNYTSTGTLTGTPVAGSWSSNTNTAGSLTHTAIITGAEITAASGSLTSATSNTFNIIVAATPLIAIANNVTQVNAANVNQGTTNHILSTFKVDVTTANATLTTANIYFDGSYIAADIVTSGLKLWYNTTNNFGAATTLQSKTAVGSGGAVETVSFTGLSQGIVAGTTGYFWVTASISATATAANTINTLTVADGDLIFSLGTASGIAAAGGTQTIVIVTPAIALADNGTQVTAANVSQNSPNNVLHKFSLAVTTANTTLTGINITTAGTYATSDLANLKVRYSTDATLDNADATLSTYNTVPTAGIVTFPAFAQLITAGTTGYIFITADIVLGAVAANTISVNAVTASQLTFSAGNKSGTTTAGGLQTVVAALPILLQWNTFGNAGTETTEPSVFNDTNIAATNLTQGTITPAGNSNRFGGSNWFNTGNTAGGNTLSEAITGNDYIQFVVTPNSGYTFTPTSLVFGWERSNTGPSSVTLRSSANSFASDLGTVTSLTTTASSGNTITISGLSNITTATTFRLYGYGATGTGGTGGFDQGGTTPGVVNVQMNGTTASTSPTLIALPTALNSFTYMLGAVTSASQTFSLSANNLTGFPANITVTGSTNYEVSTDNVSFGASTTVAYTAATLTATPIYVRLKAGLSVGFYNGDIITISGGGASTISVTCNGSVILPYYRSRQTGNWTTAESWESSSNNISWSTATVTPTNAATSITILNTHSISISAGTVTADDLTVDAGGTLSISGGTFVLNNDTETTDLQVNGTLTYSGGTFTQGASGIAFGSGSTYNHAVVGGSTIPLASWDVASTCLVTGVTTSVPANMGQTFGNFTWNCANQSVFLSVNNNAFQVNGLFRLMSTGATPNIFTMGGTTGGPYVNTLNAASIEGGVFAIAYTTGVTSTTTITTDLTISGGEVRINGSAGTGTLNIGRDLIMSGTGFLNPLFASTSPSTTITVGRDLTMSGNSLIDFEYTDTASTSSTINVGRNFTSTSAGDTTNLIVLDFGGSTTSGIVAGNTLNIVGDFSHTGTGQLRTSSNNAPTGIVFNGSGIQRFTYATAGALDWVPITINSGRTLQLQNSFSIGASSDAPATNITVNGTLDFQSFSISAGTSSIPQFNTIAGATLITANTAGLGGTGATGSLRGFNNVAAATPANGRVVFLAGTNYTFNGATTTPFSTAFGNPATINVNANVTSNHTATLAVTTALNINGSNVFKLNPANNNNITLSGVLTVAAGATFDNNGTNQIISSGSPSIVINGTFITRDPDGFVSATGTTIPGIVPTLNTGSTIEYGFAGDQAVQGGRSYSNMTISNGGIKTLSSAITGSNTISGLVTISDSSVLNVGSFTFGGSGTNLRMTGTAEYQTAGTGTKPDAEGTYDLGVGTKITFTSGSAANPVTTLQSIKLSSPVISYYNIDIVGNNVGTTALGTGFPTTNIKMQSGGTFTVKSTGTFKHSNTAGFNGSALTAIDNTNAPTITLESGSTIEYAGANQTITALPFALNSLTSTTTYSNLKISGTMTKTLPATEVLVNNNLDITSSKIQIDAQKLLTVANTINTIDDGIDIKNNGNLVQLADVLNTATTNIGKIKMTRTSRLMFDNDYIYWGSPVKENVIAQIPSNFDSTYQWDLTGTIDGAWNALSAIVPGRGFITKVASGVTTATNFDFTGTPNNGTVTVAANAYDALNSDVSGNAILLANPYPSAIDATKFVDNLNNTSVIYGTLYFWSSSTPNAGGSYNTNDYATWNKSGGVDTRPPLSNPSATNLQPLGYIAAGQGFFALLKGDGNVNFTNAMRERATGNNAQFFKTTSAHKTKTEKGRVWLNLTNNKNAFRQMLVSYITGATNGLDNMFDGPSFTGNEIDIYSIVENKHLVIQGRALPLDDADLVPLGIAITNAGEYTIAIDEVDGLMTNKTIYLEDKLLHKTHNLSDGVCTFTTAAGTFNDRFVLRYTDAILGTKDPKLVENQVLVFTKDKKIKVNSVIENINTVTVYDLLGRQLIKKDKVNNKEFTLLNLVAKQQMLLVKVLLENGETLSKKVMF